MKRALCLLLLLACGDERFHGEHDVVDSTVYVPECGLCNPLAQTGCGAGEKCTWAVDSWLPLIGHIGCVRTGTVPLEGACSFAARPSTQAGCSTQLADDCVRGALCMPVNEGTGVCKPICDNQGGNPMCDATHACVTYPSVFSTGATSPPAAGVCELACDPLADNDFDGSGSALTRTGTICSSATDGCYGIPSGGTPPVTAFTCMPDRNYDLPLRHRTECASATGCADTNGTIYVNSCNQGYLPLFRESTAVSTAVCVAMCAPLDCYAGNCGSNDENRHGAAPHRCMQPDAVGAFGSGEECEYLWAEELDGSGHWLPSPWSDRVGFCFDHSQYLYDPTGGNTPTTPLPSCKDLPLHGSGSAFAADDFGCISSQTAGLSFRGKPRALPRTLYHREMP